MKYLIRTKLEESKIKEIPETGITQGVQEMEEDFRGEFPEDTPADQGMRAARKDNAPDVEQTFSTSEVKDLMKTLLSEVLLRELDGVGGDYTDRAADRAVEEFFGREEEINEKEFSEDKRDKLAKSGDAEKDGSYPIENENDLKNAVRAYGRSKDKVKTKRHIMSRARSLGATDKIPANWK